MTDAAKLLSIARRLRVELETLDRLELDDVTVRGEVQLAACQVQYALDILEQCQLVVASIAAEQTDLPH
ncbi:hypothetical protein [Sphingomonas nostoxanthinifaciens]|uniref:hypothetical protein n=1 Tax=Sphingomonas nostoxanthinifaciens TaxID=2872652 RepID=UPI001CC1D2A3|nr:hypothetical protein [Sphingomonas nostoxanthinifaciens]UAK23703.1 hypothetical protein K8P63_15135 [Sphingomonas nostoxanthinifaciens]